MKAIIRITAYILPLLLTLLPPLAGSAEIYKYQDERGHWHFTDKPQPGAVVDEDGRKDDRNAAEATDLEALLTDRFMPDTPVEKASLSVVAIETPLIQGSGFFISEHGHILTNKHIVRPSETTEWKEKEEKLQETDRLYRKSDRAMNIERGRLKEMEAALKDYRKAIDRADDDYAKRVAEAEYKLFMDRYHDRKLEYRLVKQEYLDNKREHERARRDFNIFSSTSILAKRFKIIIKNDEELTAQLVSVSDEHDLALLKLDHYKTPYIRPGKIDSLRHGMKVFAIGSPLGMKDVITSGVIAGIKEGNVITDATILPGSSGGPLLTADGEVIGINSLRVSQVIGGEGFGVAISIESALSDFKQQIDRH